MISEPRPVVDGIVLRPAVVSDAGALAAALVRSRAYMRPWEPDRPDAFYTAEGQAARLAERLAERAAGRVVPWLLADGDEIVGGLTLSNVALGPFRSANLGYWIDVTRTGRGLATAAVEEVCRAARDDLGLHRVEAGTVLANAASQRVLVKCGFEEIGIAPSYLHINGEWRDHKLFQRVLHNQAPTQGSPGRAGR